MLKLDRPFISLDIETLGTNPGATILSIGCAEFNPVNGDIVRTFHEYINLKDSQDHFFDIDMDTMLWWMKQSDAARVIFNEVMASKNENLDVLQKLREWWPKKAYMVSHDFDKNMLKEWADHLGRKLPWHFRDHVDLRTLVSLVDGDSIYNAVALEYPDLIDHDALDDAVFQAKVINRCLKDIGVV